MSAASRDETWNPGLAHRVESASYLNPVNLVNRKARSHKVKGPVNDNTPFVFDRVPTRRHVHPLPKRDVPLRPGDFTARVCQ